MNAQHPAAIEELLEKLNRGDESAAEHVFLAYEPFLRMVVRRQLSATLRAKFDSADVVQSVWADLLRRFRKASYNFPDVEHLRAFLIQATRNRFLDHLRRRLGELKHEQSFGHTAKERVPVSSEPEPSALMEADEMWERILAACPPAHLAVVELRRQGKLLAEIAAETGLHEGSVRRILGDLARRVGARAGTREDVP